MQAENWSLTLSYLQPLSPYLKCQTKTKQGTILCSSWARCRSFKKKSPTCLMSLSHFPRMKKKIKKEKDATCLCHSVVSSSLKRFFFFFFSEHCTEGFLDAQLISMDRTVMPGLEVAPSTSPQAAAQPDENKYYIGSERWNRPDSDQSGHSDFIQPNQSNDRSQVKSQSLSKLLGSSL